MSLPAEALRGAQSVIDALKKDGQLVHDPSLIFLKEYLISLGAKLPEPVKKSAASVDGEDFSDLNDEGVVPPDSDAPQEMGPSGEVELSEADADALTDLKGAAAAAASEEKWDDAIAGFTKAIKMMPSALLYAKRAECYLKLKKPNAAIRDCDAALGLNPDSAKAFKARGVAHRMLGHWEKASADLGTGLSIDFDEGSAAVQKVVSEKALAIKRRKGEAEAAKEAAEKVERAKRAAAAAAARASASSAPTAGGGGGGFPGMGGMGGMGGMPGMGGMGGMGGMPGMPGMGGIPPELLNAVMQDPELMGAMMDPRVQKAMQECMSNPAAMAKYQNDPVVSRVIEKIGKIMGGAMGGMGGMGGGFGGGGGGAPADGGPRFEEIDEDEPVPAASRPATSVNDVD